MKTGAADIRFTFLLKLGKKKGEGKGEGEEEKEDGEGEGKPKAAGIAGQASFCLFCSLLTLQ